MHKLYVVLSVALYLLVSNSVCAQDSWRISANNIQAPNYYGVTSANGMLGIVSSAEPMKVKQVVLSGLYDMTAGGELVIFYRDLIC